MRISQSEFDERTKWPLMQKVDHALGVIDQFYNHNNGSVYASFSGGKDSTVMLWLIRKIFPDVPGVFVDTGLEYPEIREFVKTIENIEWVKPQMKFREVLNTYGYPVISKMQAQYIEQYRTGSDHMKNLRWHGRDYGYGPQYKISDEWKFMVNAPFKISDKCCQIMKKTPMKLYEKETGRQSYIGIMATESSQRKKQYLQDGCNIFKNDYSVSRPIAIFNEKDIWDLIEKYDIPYSKIYDMGFKRTGCMFCLFGTHLNNPNRFQIMAKTHPKQYNYCMNKLGLKEVLKYMKLPFNPVHEKQLNIEFKKTTDQ